MKRLLIFFTSTLLVHQTLHAQTALELQAQDTRNSATSPSSYTKNLALHFKYHTAIGLPKLGTGYSAVIGLRGWETDNTGGKAHELVFSDDNEIRVRSGFSPSWETWRRIITENNSGNVGIGTSTPTHKLHIEGDQYVSGNLQIGVPYSMHSGQSNMGYGAGIQMYGNSDPIWLRRFNVVPDVSELRVNIGDDGNDRFVVGYTFYADGEWKPSVSITASGAMGIGTTSIPSGYRLAVGGSVIAEKVKVQLQNNWPDYVFDSSYRLRPLSDVEKYIQQYKRLPDMLSAKEVEDQGLDVGNNQAVLLKKIEELTLYIIEQDKELKSLRSELNQLKGK